MQGLRQFILILLVMGMPTLVHSAENPTVFAGQDLYLSAKNLVSSPPSTNEHYLVFNENFSLVIGGFTFTSDSAVIRLEGKIGGFRGQNSIYYNAKAYLQAISIRNQPKIL